MELFDKVACNDIDTDKNRLIPWYIMANLAFNNNDPILSDAIYNRMVGRIFNEFDELEHELKIQCIAISVMERKVSIAFIPESFTNKLKLLRMVKYVFTTSI